MIKEIQKKNDSKTLIKFPVLEGDSQIYLGQTIVTLVRMGIENNIAYSDETQHRFKVELMASVLSELDVSLDDLKTLSKILCKWKQDSVVSLFLYLNSVFKHKHKLIHNQAPV